MLTFADIKKMIDLAQPAMPTINLSNINICLSVGRSLSSSSNEIRYGEYSVKYNRIMLSRDISFKRGFAVFLHELGHLLAHAQFGDFCNQISAYEHEMLADNFAMDIADEIGFDFCRWTVRTTISKAIYSKNLLVKL